MDFEKPEVSMLLFDLEKFIITNWIKIQISYPNDTR